RPEKRRPPERARLDRPDAGRRWVGGAAMATTFSAHFGRRARARPSILGGHSGGVAGLAELERGLGGVAAGASWRRSICGDGLGDDAGGGGQLSYHAGSWRPAASAVDVAGRRGYRLSGDVWIAGRVHRL